LMEKAGVPVVPGYHGDQQADVFLKRKAYEIGYPVLIKAVAGGGGRGMRRVDKHADFDDALAGARREAESAFGDPRVLIEKYIEAPRHIEFQVFGDSGGQVIHLNERDCSLQRRHQKVIEEAPAPGMTPELRAEIGRVAVEAARAIGYVGAGTVEFIASAEPRLKSGGFWFVEMNTRLQVEHPVTEAITGFDLVEWQFRIADGESISIRQDEVPLNGHAVEARLYAEDPDRGFLPSPGRIVALDLPHGEGIRVDAGVAAGLTVPPDYDPMIAKVIAHGATREAALDRLAAALDDTVVVGPRVNTPFLRALVTHPRFRAGKFDTGFIDAHLSELIAADPAEAMRAAADGVLFLLERERRRVAHRGAIDAPVSWPSPWAADDGFSLGPPRRLTFDIVVDGAARQAVATWGPDGAQVSVDGIAARHNDRIIEMGEGVVVAARRPHHVAFKRADASGSASAGEDTARAPMNGKVIAVLVAPGQAVKLGTRVAVMEAMKMEHSLSAPRDGTVAEIAAVGAQVAEGDAVVRLEPNAPRAARLAGVDEG
jgi:3-methylcrotonyl-CoA carboxylase alpha subunit